MNEMNWFAIAASAVSAFVLGGIWYSPALFGKVWQREAGVGDEHFKGGHGALVFGLSFLMSLVSAMALAFFLGPKPSIDMALTTSVVIGLCFVASSFGINYLFSKRSTLLFVIDGGYHVIQFALYGLILGAWH
jgi:hypothetical protein